MVRRCTAQIDSTPGPRRSTSRSQRASMQALATASGTSRGFAGILRFLPEGASPKAWPSPLGGSPLSPRSAVSSIFFVIATVFPERLVLAEERFEAAHHEGVELVHVAQARTLPLG